MLFNISLQESRRSEDFIIPAYAHIPRDNDSWLWNRNIRVSRKAARSAAVHSP
jgi:hypothetical protein